MSTNRWPGDRQDLLEGHQGVGIEKGFSAGRGVWSGALGQL